MVEIIKTYLPILISCVAFGLSLYVVLRERSKIFIAWDICCNDKGDKNWISIKVTNLGRQTALIDSVGYFDISLGVNVTAENKSLNQILAPSESKEFKEMFSRKDMWKIGKLYAVDGSGKY